MGKISRQAQTEGTPSKSRRGFNFIDVLLILFILLVIVAAVNIVSPMSVFDRFKTDSERTIEYTVEIIGVDGEFIDKIKEEYADKKILAFSHGFFARVMQAELEGVTYREVTLLDNCEIRKFDI